MGCMEGREEQVGASAGAEWDIRGLRGYSGGFLDGPGVYERSPRNDGVVRVAATHAWAGHRHRERDHSKGLGKLEYQQLLGVCRVLYIMWFLSTYLSTISDGTSLC